MRRRAWLKCAALCFWTSGCGAPPPVLGPELTSDIPPGVYSGEVTSYTRAQRDDNPAEEETTTTTESLVVDSSGMPLLNGRRPRQNLVIDDSVGGFSGRITITAVNVFPSQVVIDAKYDVRLGEGVTLVATARETYEFAEPDTLRYEFQLTGAATNPDVTSILTMLWTSEGVFER
jgi:hypothetical protein